DFSGAVRRSVVDDDDLSRRKFPAYPRNDVTDCPGLVLGRYDDRQGRLARAHCTFTPEPAVPLAESSIATYFWSSSSPLSQTNRLSGLRGGLCRAAAMCSRAAS